MTDFDPRRWRAALAQGDVRVLLMVLVHLSGDTRWLEPPYRPARDARLISDPDAGLPPEVQQRIRDALAALIEADPSRLAGAPGPIHDPGDALIHRMMCVCLGENVPPEYAPLTREEMGLVPRDVEWPSPPAADTLADQHVLIVGAGVFGLVLGIKLAKLGIPFTIVEKNDEVGGTWYENRYPGCGVDTPNHSYSLSFGPRPAWSRYFSPRDEIQQYVCRIADTFDLRRHIRLRTELTSARWDDAGQRWIAELTGPVAPDRPDGRRVLQARFLVSAIGQFNRPVMADIPGRDRFAGPLFHTARWPDGLELAGRRVAIIGTGASAMQIAPTIADRVAQLTLYQRSPQWVRPIPGYHDPIGEGAQWLLAHLPYYAAWFRFTMAWRYGDGLLPFLRKDPDWPHPARAMNRGNDRHRRDMEDFIRAELGDREDLIARCVPSYPPYGKRILLDNGWYRTLRRPHVELVTEAIAGIEPDGVRTEDGRLREADVVVFSTGFDYTSMASRLGIVGRDGLDLRTAWDGDNPTAHLGITVPGFPNFFCLLGPNTGLGHGGSAMFQAECQARYVTACLVAMQALGAGSLEVRREVHDAYVSRVDAEHRQMIWAHPGMRTYYRNRRGRVFSVMPWRLVDYWRMTHDPDLDEYRLEPRRAPARQADRA